MPVKTVTLAVAAVTEKANREIAATGAYFEKLRDLNPVELSVKFDRLQAIAQSKILARELSTTVRDTVKLDLDRAAGDAGGIGLIARLFKGGKGPGAGLPGFLGDIPKAGELPPAAAIGALAAGLAALPFLAQAAAGGITLALGGGLAALGVAGALGTGKTVTAATVTAAQDALRAAQLRQIVAQDKLNQLMASGTTNAAKLASAQAAVASSSGSVLTAQQKLNLLLNNQQDPSQLAMRKALTNLTNDAQTSLAQIGKSFQPVLLSIFTTANSILLKMTPVIAGAVKVISGPFQNMADTLIKSLASPQAITAIKTLGVAFAGLLNAFTPAIPGIVTSIADGFTNLFRAVARNPKAFAEMATGLFHLIGILLDVLAWLTQIANYVEHHWKDVFLGVIAPILDHWRGLATFFTVTLPRAFDILKESVRIAFDQLEIIALKAVNGMLAPFARLPFGLGKPFQQARAAIGSELTRLQGDVLNAVNNISSDWARLNGQTSTLVLTIAGTGPIPGKTFPRGFAAGTMSASPGWAWVGERGPELVRFGGGEQVVPAGVARGYASGAGRNPQIDELIGAVQENTDVLASAIGALAGVTAQAPAVMGAAAAGGARASAYAELYR